jgi:hypothetical protein
MELHQLEHPDPICEPVNELANEPPAIERE